MRGSFVDAPVKPCPWCKKTPQLSMLLDWAGESYDKTWVWIIGCNCRVESKASISIRKTNKTDLTRFLHKLDEWYDRWNAGNDCKAYEKKVIDLRKIPNLWS